ncbi:hypothetical protein N658DRAFT_501136 [Parathielavia hyrcaniae]|uniref:Uncharacterized protein n=1 Tax=Parathielavia hyrcaniae TaxID=113614 RepID=A0AAN6PRW9_9PEZI|nr:hypothetical protein N658DRAFT_501136 [Parathielavia hyrcaniae]
MSSQLPNNQLVTPVSLARKDVNGMDHARCAALHNYLIDYCLAADGRLNEASEGSQANYFSTFGDAADAVRQRLHPSVADFLIAAWDRLCGAIEVRRRQSSGATVDDDSDDNRSSEPLLTSVALDAAKIANPSFAHAFLCLARRPRHIHQIAPGFSLPRTDAAAFAAAQPFTHMPRQVRHWHGTEPEGIVPPVYLFFSHAGVPQVDVSRWRSSFRGH